METIISDELRYRYFCLTISLFSITYFYFSDGRIYVSLVLALILFSLFLPKYIIYLDKKKGQGVYFTSKSVLAYKNNVLLFEIPWEDITVLTIKNFFEIKDSFTLKLISKTKPNNYVLISVIWFTEKSFLDIFKRFAPPDHEAFHLAKNFSEKRKLFF